MEVSEAAKMRKFILGSMVLILLLFILYAVIWPGAPISVPDSTDYMFVAEDLLDLGIDGLHDRTIGYPLLLLLTKSYQQPTRFLYYFQLSLHFLSVLVLTYFLTRLQIATKHIAIFLFLALIPPSVANAAHVLTETLTQFILALGVFFLLLYLDKGKTLFVIISGILLAFSALIRPTYQLLFVALSAGLLLLLLFDLSIRRRLMRAIVIVSIFSTTIIGGFSLYNFQRFGYFGLTPLFGFNLSTRTARFVERLPDDYAEIREALVKSRDASLTARGSSHTGTMYIWGAIPELERITNLSRPELSSYMLRLNILLIRNAPLEYFQEVLRALAIYWFPSSTELSNFDSRPVQFLWAAVHFGAVALFAVVSCLVLGSQLLLLGFHAELREKVLTRNKNSLHIFLIPLTIILYTMAVSTVFEVGNPRYRTPTDILMFFNVAVGLSFWRKLRSSLSSLVGNSSVAESLANAFVFPSSSEG